LLAGCSPGRGLHCLEILMAVRTGAGTGVIVSLVVFVLTTVFLLVLTIVFYAGKTKETEAKVAAEQSLATYIANNQRNADIYKNFESAARERRMSVAQYLNQRYEDALAFFGNQPNATLDTIRQDFSRFSIKEGDTVRGAMQKLAGDLNAARSEAEAYKTQLADANKQISEKDAQMAAANQACEQRVQDCEGQIASYRDAAEDYRKRMEEAVDALNQAGDAMRNEYEAEKSRLNDEVDNLEREKRTLEGKVKEFERIRAEAIVRAQNPAMQVDGKIIDVQGDQVFIDRGKRDRIMLGMNFELYGDQSQIRVNPQTGEVPRGKASMQVVKVDETTSTCKVTRTSTGQPIVRGDVIANAVYDPKYVYKFLIHGKFDVDGDGKPTETEAEYLRSLVLQWGGTVVSGDELPGDLDFLVLGSPPPEPPPPAADAPQALLTDFIKRKEAVDLYKRLLNQATNAQIPVLNANRFFILTGYVDR
jgi:hypothetical protein